MKIKQNKLLALTAAILLSSSLARFLLYYVSSFIAESPFFTYASIYFSEISDALLPLIAALSLAIVCNGKNFKKSFLFAFFLSFSHLIYFFPYYAFEYAYQGYEIGAVLLFSFLTSVLAIAIEYVKMLVLLFIIIFVFQKIDKSKEKGNFEIRTAILAKRNPLDLQIPVNTAVFSSAFLIFSVKLVCEIIDTVIFLIDYSGTYRLNEIFYIAFRYIFLLSLLLLSHLAVSLLSQKLTKCSMINENDTLNQNKDGD